jgi:predicted site-specific integrase-resolvase
MSEQYVHYLTTEETAQALGVSRRTLARYKSNYKITPISVNNKDMYSTDEIARFKAGSASQSDKILKQHLFNSARIVELEARVALLESLLNTSSSKILLNIGDVDVESLSNTLQFLCTRSIDTWELQGVEDLSNDVARMGDRLIKKLGKRCQVALEVAYTVAASSKDMRAPVASALAKIQLDRVKTVLG